MTKARSRTYRGLALADGVAVGKVKLVDVGHFPAQVPRHEIHSDDVERELKRLRAACAKARTDLLELADRVESELGSREAEMIRPQAMMVEDPGFISEVEEIVRKQSINCEAAVADVIERFERLIGSLDDKYLRERSTDVRDAGRRILGNLLFVDGYLAPSLEEPAIVVSSHLVPSLTVHLERDKVLAFATEHGGSTSHAAILARSMGIPAVSGLQNLCSEVVDGQAMIVDGNRGVAVVQPAGRKLKRYIELADRFRERRRLLIESSSLPTVTTDGHTIQVHANVGRPNEVDLADEYSADGLGLYRTEFEFLTESTLPTEDQLTESYVRATQIFAGKEIILRALDIGGDKFPPAVPVAHEENPFLGVRGVRLLLQHVDDLMMPQFRAMVRAAEHGNLSVLYPMISGVGEVRAMLKRFEEAREQVSERTGRQAPHVRQGIMIEVPSCIPILEELLAEVDFASVGTNDLVQYLLAADRNSERVADVYDPYHPAVIRTLETIREVADEAGKDVSVCGEIASDPAFLPVLIGLGYRTVSVNVGAIPFVKQSIRQLTLSDCRQAAARLVGTRTAARVKRRAQRFLRDSTKDR